MVMKELVNKSVINLNGYGCCDSFGYNVKYGIYIFIDDDIGKVVVFSVI